MKQEKKMLDRDIDRRNLSTEDFCSSVQDLVSLLEDKETASLLAKRVAPIFCEMKNIRHKELMYEGFLYGVCGITDAERENAVMLGTDYTTKALKNLLPSFEKIKNARLLEEAMDLSLFFWELANMRNKESNAFDDNMQTEEARVKHSNLYRLMPLVKVLECYLKKVEDLWHPIKENGEEDKCYPHKGKKFAIKSIYDKFKSEILVILEKNGEKSDFLKTFSKCFDTYIDICKSYTGATPNGNIPRRRKPRSEASKEKSRQSALKKWEERRQEKAKKQV